MSYNPHDTIAATATAPGGGARAIVRISGDAVFDCLAHCFTPADGQPVDSTRTGPQAIPGTVRLATHGNSLSVVPCDVFFWPTAKSYTRSPAAELHTIGSPPLVRKLLTEICQFGARIAEPGEFTLRAFLAGRIDLTQAEAVLGVIDAQSGAEFTSALTQLAGGLSTPLAELRELLLGTVAELEAGLDFVDEDLEFISRQALQNRITAAQETVADVQSQIADRMLSTDLPSVVLVGPPNAGKSSLFNKLVAVAGDSDAHAQALVSPAEGTTRDYLSAVLRHGDIRFMLVDTAGVSAGDPGDRIKSGAQSASASRAAAAELRLLCTPCDAPQPIAPTTDGELLVVTKADLEPTGQPVSNPARLRCSSLTGQGFQQLLERIVQVVRADVDNASHGIAATAVRCEGCLGTTRNALSAALELANTGGGDELIAAELRTALAEVGQVVGAVYTDDILDRIFGQFCIGK